MNFFNRRPKRSNEEINADLKRADFIRETMSTEGYKSIDGLLTERINTYLTGALRNQTIVEREEARIKFLEIENLKITLENWKNFTVDEIRNDTKITE
jgi:hypothetical protein